MYEDYYADYYGEDFSYMLEEMLGTGLGAFIAIYLVILLVILAVGIVAYVLRSLAYYSIAKRRGIHNAWLAWLPIGESWILGCISDQYQYVVNGQVRSKRKVLLVLNIIINVLSVATMILSIGNLMELVSAGEGADMYAAMGSSMTLVLLSLVNVGISIAVVVIQYIAMFDLYRSCDPNNSVLYLVFSILVNTLVTGLSILQPIFLFICRNKDLGMPARRPTAYT